MLVNAQDYGHLFSILDGFNTGEPLLIKERLSGDLEVAYWLGFV
jgi:hypothetical protein